MSFERFDRYVTRNSRAFAERLQSVCRLPSVAVRGSGMRPAMEAIERLMQRVGAGTRPFKIGSGYPILYGECGSSSKSVLVYGHYDVAPVGQLNQWSYGPFSSTLVDGKLFARGAANGKGDLVARLSAVEAYQKSFGKLPVCLKFIVEGEAGIGSPSLRRFANENSGLLRAEGSIWSEGFKDTNERFVISLGFKGIVFVELRVKGAKTDLHSKWGAIVPNPAWRMVQALSTLTSPKGVITIDGFTSNVVPISREDDEILKSIDFDEAGLKREFQVSGWIRGMKGHTVVKELIFGPTCTICGIQTGHTEAGPKTVLPGSAVARLDFRLVPDLTPRLVINLLRAHLDARGFKDIEIVDLGSIPTAKSNGDSLVARAAIAAAEEVYEKNPVVYPLHPSSGPAGIMCGVNDPPVPVISFGTAYSGSNPHGPDENIRMDDFIENVRFFGRLIHNLAAKQVAQSEEPETKELILPV